VSSILSDLGDVAEKYTGEALAFGLGFALANVLSPVGTELKQTAWSKSGAQILAMDPKDAAAIVAEALETEGWGESEAAQAGLNAERFGDLVQTMMEGPGFAQLLELVRRGLANDGNFEHGLRKLRLEPMWDTMLADLANVKLSPELIAVMVQRGILANPGLLPVGPPSDVGEVPPMPQVAIDPVAEAATSGVDKDRLAAMTRIIGLPPGPGELLSLLNRGAIVEADFTRGIAEGNMRNEWAPYFLALRRLLITPNEYAELRLRGWIDDAAMYAGASLSGMEEDDTALLFKLLGRPIPVHQVTTGIARGGTYNGDTSQIPEAYLRSLEEGNQRPEWYSLSYANRYTIPGYFVLRAIIQAGGLTADEGATYFEQSGWEPDLAKKAASAYAASTGSTPKRLTAAQYLAEYEAGYITRDELVGDLENMGYAPAEAEAYAELGDARRAKAALDARLNRIHTRYVSYKLTDDEAQTALAALNIPEPAHDLVWESWQAERELNATLLTEAQIVKAYTKNVYTSDQALAALQARGYSEADAQTLLAIA